MNLTSLHQRVVAPPAKPDHVDREPPEHPSGDPPASHPTTRSTRVQPRQPSPGRASRRTDAPHC